MSGAGVGIVSCAGAPRDLGLDQGAAVRAAVRAAVAELPLVTRIGVGSRLASGGGGGRSRRDAARYFPHMSERLAGLARGAGVSRSALAVLLERELSGEGSAGAARALAVGPERTGSGPLLARIAPPVPGSILRRSAPEHDWSSLEVAMPWLVPALCGVNERGLAVAALAFAAEPGTAASSAAPALLLAQDCLQRCDSVQKAIEWCERRSAGGFAALLLADAAGDIAEVRVRGTERRLCRPRQGVLASTGAAAAASDVEKACAAHARLDVAALWSALGAADRGGCIVLDPAARALEVDGVRHPVAETR